MSETSYTWQPGTFSLHLDIFTGILIVYSRNSPNEQSIPGPVTNSSRRTLTIGSSSVITEDQYSTILPSVNFEQPPPTGLSPVLPTPRAANLQTMQPTGLSPVLPTPRAANLQIMQPTGLSPVLPTPRAANLQTMQQTYVTPRNNSATNYHPSDSSTYPSYQAAPVSSLYLEKEQSCNSSSSISTNYQAPVSALYQDTEQSYDPGNQISPSNVTQNSPVPLNSARSSLLGKWKITQWSVDKAIKKYEKKKLSFGELCSKMREMWQKVLNAINSHKYEWNKLALEINKFRVLFKRFYHNSYHSIIDQWFPNLNSVEEARAFFLTDGYKPEKFITEFINGCDSNKK